MPRTKYSIDLRVDRYINSLPRWQQEVCWQVRDLAHAADVGVRETIKRTKLPAFHAGRQHLRALERQRSC